MCSVDICSMYAAKGSWFIESHQSESLKRIKQTWRAEGGMGEPCMAGDVKVSSQVVDTPVRSADAFSISNTAPHNRNNPNSDCLAEISQTS